ncbi:cell wall hydrolase [Blautia sp. Sow4_E7]|uniref:cell wall hydrolase n=1 Tax=Blautia sp. Sow4_E7 TaxID=3438749 RepID=UPI003F91EDFC
MRKRKIKVLAVDAAMLFLAIQFTTVIRAEHERKSVNAPSVNYEIVDCSYDVADEEPETEVFGETIWSSRWNEEERKMLLKIAMAEAEGESTEGKALVMLVVLNRVWSDRFPGTIEDVIFQKGQFTPVRNGGRYWTTEPNEDCYKALELVEYGWDESMGALYFSSEPDCWMSRNTEYLFTEGNHNFYR